MEIDRRGRARNPHTARAVVPMEVVAFVPDVEQVIVLSVLWHREAQVSADSPVNGGGFPVVVAVDGQAGDHDKAAAGDDFGAEGIGIGGKRGGGEVGLRKRGN